MKRTTVAAFAALALAGCAPAAAPEPTPTVTVTAEAPAPEPEPTPEPSDAVVNAAMELAWQDMDAESQDAMCLVFDLDEDMAWDAFTEGSGEDFLTRAEFVDFFTGKC